MGVADRYEKRKKLEENTSVTSGGVEYRYKVKNAPAISEEISSRLSKLEKRSSYFFDIYKSRYFDEDGNYIDAYRDDSKVWNRTVEIYKNDFDEESQYIKNLLDEYSDFFDKETITSINEAFDTEGKNFSDIYSHANTEVDYFSNFKNEDEYNQWFESYKKSLETQEKHKAMANSEQGLNGWNQYIADETKAKEEKEAEEKNRSFVEKFFTYLGRTSDTTMPGVAEMNTAINAIREDDSYQKPNDNWTNEQKKVFGYLYVSNPDEAYQYAIDTNATINRAKEAERIKNIKDSATSNGWAGFGHTLGAIATAPLGLSDYLYDIATINAGKPVTSDGEISPFEYSQAVTEGISTKLNDASGTLNEMIPIIGGKGLGDVYGLGTSIAQSLSSAYTLGTVGTLISYFGQGAASGVDDALSRGASEGQAVIYGTSLGVFEGLAEMVGVDNLFKLGSSATVKGFIKNIMKQAGAEGAEEGLTSLFSNIADNVIMQDKSNFNAHVTQYMAQGMSEKDAKKKAWMDSVEDIAFDTIAGAVSGGVSGSLHTSVANIIANKEASQLYGNGAELVAEAKEIGGDAGTLAEKYQSKLDKGKSLSGGEINRLVELNEHTLNTQDITKMTTATEARLTELGETGDVSIIAKAIVKKALGEKLTSSENSALESSKYGQRVVNEISPEGIESGEYTSAWAENIGTERINTESYNRDLVEQVRKIAEEQLSAANTSKQSVVDETPTESKYEVSEDGKTSIIETGKAVEVKKIESISESGEANLTVDDGMVVKASDISFGTDAEAIIVGKIADIKIGNQHINSETANFLYHQAMTELKSNPDMSVSEANSLITGLAESYLHGVYNFGIERLTATDKNGRAIYYAGEISESQRKSAYELGRKDSIAHTEAKQKVIDDRKAKAEPKVKKKHLGKVVFENDANVDESTLTPTQKANLDGIKLLAEISNIEFHIFRSDKVGNTFMYTMANGTVTSANGWYVAGTNEIWIDINAGSFGEGTMIRTAAHEISHYIKDNSPKQWQVMADLLMETFAKNDINTEGMLNKQKAKIKKRLKANKQTIPPESVLTETAYEEFVSDALTDMLADGSIVNFIAEVKQKNKNLAKKILDAIKNLLSKWGLVIDSYNGRELETDEAQALSQFEDVFKKLQEMYQNALMDADAAYAAVGNVQAQKNNTGEGDVKFADRTFSEQVDAVLNGEDTVSTHLRISEHTPQILLDLGLNDKALLITSVHTKTAVGEKVRNKNTHYVSKEILKKLPQLIEKPAIVMESTTKGSIVMFVNAVDSNNNPVVCAIKVDGKGFYNSVEIESNIVTSVYGKDTNPIGFIEKAVAENRLLYWDKKMSQKLFDIPRLQLPNNIYNFDSNVIIRKINETVKENSEK